MAAEGVGTAVGEGTAEATGTALQIVYVSSFERDVHFLHVIAGEDPSMVARILLALRYDSTSIPLLVDFFVNYDFIPRSEP